MTDGKKMFHIEIIRLDNIKEFVFVFFFLIFMYVMMITKYQSCPTSMRIDVRVT